MRILRSPYVLVLAAAAVLMVLAIGLGAQTDDEPMTRSEMIEAGRLIYEETAGGVGCAYCHGLDGNGDGTAGVEAARVVGAEESALRGAMSGAVPLMTFITLSEEEFWQVYEYLQYLLELEAEAAGADSTGTPADGDGSATGGENGGGGDGSGD